MTTGIVVGLIFLAIMIISRGTSWYVERRTGQAVVDSSFPCKYTASLVLQSFLGLGSISLTAILLVASFRSSGINVIALVVATLVLGLAVSAIVAMRMTDVTVTAKSFRYRSGKKVREIEIQQIADVFVRNGFLVVHARGERPIVIPAVLKNMPSLVTTLRSMADIR